MDIMEARRILKSFYASRTWVMRVNKMDDKTVLTYLNNLKQQRNLRKSA
jgi:hypothetical protein